MSSKGYGARGLWDKVLHPFLPQDVASCPSRPQLSARGNCPVVGASRCITTTGAAVAQSRQAERPRLAWIRILWRGQNLEGVGGGCQDAFRGTAVVPSMLRMPMCNRDGLQHPPRDPGREIAVKEMTNHLATEAREEVTFSFSRH